MRGPVREVPLSTFELTVGLPILLDSPYPRGGQKDSEMRPPLTAILARQTQLMSEGSWARGLATASSREIQLDARHVSALLVRDLACLGAAEPFSVMGLALRGWQHHCRIAKKQGLAAEHPHEQLVS